MSDNRPMFTETSSQIAALNDKTRRTFTGCKVIITPGIHGLKPQSIRSIIDAVRTFDDFTPDNDPYNEHDFGSFQYKGMTIFWKFDYYDPDLSMHSLDASDPAITARVLTIMLADEY